jgi:nucleotide-binding universal stress UspA family protein
VLERLLLGSVAERIAREAPCRVLVVRDDAAQEPGTIVLGDDLWEHSRAARRDALALAEAFSARLDVVHAVEGGIPYLRAMQGALPDPVLEKLRAEADAKLDDLLRDAPPGLEATRAVVLDDPAHAICARAEQLRADLVVVGTRSASDIERVLLGSVAGKVLSHAPCSVLVVR